MGFKFLCFGFYLTYTEVIWLNCVKHPTKLGRIWVWGRTRVAGEFC